MSWADTRQTAPHTTQRSFFIRRSTGTVPGTLWTPVGRSALHAPDRALNDASRITVPILFHLQWDDEIFPRAGQLDLFDAFAGPERELRAFPGLHGHTPEHARGLWLSFINRYLASPGVVIG